MPCILTRCRAFVLLGCNTAPYKRLQRVLYCQCNYTAHNTRLTQAAIIPPAPRWSVCQRLDGLHRYQIPPPRRDAAQVSTAAYYNKVYISVQHITNHASPAGSAPTVCGSLASVAPGAPVERSASPPAQGQPGGVSMLPTPDGLQSGTGSAVRAGSLAPSTRRGSPAVGSRASGAEPLAALAAALFGLSPDS